MAIDISWSTNVEAKHIDNGIEWVCWFVLCVNEVNLLSIDCNQTTVTTCHAIFFVQLLCGRQPSSLSAMTSSPILTKLFIHSLNPFEQRMERPHSRASQEPPSPLQGRGRVHPVASNLASFAPGPSPQWQWQSQGCQGILRPQRRIASYVVFYTNKLKGKAKGQSTSQRVGEIKCCLHMKLK